MPRNVRNFWIDLDVDGKKEKVATGPKSKDGGFDMALYWRSHGAVHQALRLVGRADGNGKLHLKIWDGVGQLVESFETER
jgi:hypothetical protein